MGKCPSVFRLSYRPVVLTFSFTRKELQTNPLHTLQSRFEQLDIKLLTDYNVKWTTHVVSKKRNTAKGLQALINAKHIVTESFLDAVVEAANAPGGDVLASSGLEQDYEQNWPNALQYVPPPGGEPIQHEEEIYAPDQGRHDIFEGFTFIFYDDTQYNNLLAPITNGGGKAVFEKVQAEVTTVDDFVRFVKSVAGEKGLGEFEDGSEGKGVVLVRYLPSKGSGVEWYTSFLTQVSLRLDHRSIEQSEFLEAILTKDATILRKPLQVESTPNTQTLPPATRSTRSQRAQAPSQPEPTPEPEATEPQQPAATRSRARRPVRRRFAGFAEDDSDMDEKPAPAPAPAPPAVTIAPPPVEEEGLFVSQQNEEHNDAASVDSGRSGTKRQASALPEDNLMEGMAPAAARFKRQRLELGEPFASPTPEPEPPEKAPPEPKKKIKKEVDILAVAAQHREEEETRARREKEDLAQLPSDVDLSEIRRLNIVEEMPVRGQGGGGGARTREQDIADGRWNPKWNGMKNFKKFKRRGEVAGRQPARIIVPLQEARNKEFGVGDDYWLEDESGEKRKRSQQQQQRESQPSAPTAASSSEAPPPPLKAARVVLLDDSESDRDESSLALESLPLPTRTAGRRRATPAAAAQPSADDEGGGTNSTGRSQSSRPTTQSQSQGQAKRPAPSTSSTDQQTSKRQRPARRTRQAQELDDSDDDEFKFRFGKRR